MSLLSFTGNLTQDAKLKTTETGKPYILLRLAENINKKEKGEYVKDENEHYVTLATTYHSVFVFDGGLCFQSQHLKSGDPLYVKGVASFETINDENGFDANQLTSIRAVYLNTKPFEKKETSAIA